MKNQKGEIATATIVLIAAGALVVGLLTGSKGNLFSFLQKSAANKKASFSKQSEIHTPVILQSKDGKTVAVGTKVENLYETGMEDGEPVLTYGQRVAKFFAGLTNLAFLVLIVGLIFFPVLTIGALRAWGMKHYKTAKAIVQGVKEAPPEAAAQVKASIAVVMDKKEKKVVDEIKKDLN